MYYCIDNIVIMDDTNDTNVIREYERDEYYLRVFLKKIKNKNGTYKRICVSPLRYAGGKSKAIGLI